MRWYLLSSIASLLSSHSPECIEWSVCFHGICVSIWHQYKHAALWLLKEADFALELLASLGELLLRNEIPSLFNGNWVETSKAAFPSICHNFLLRKVPTIVCTLWVRKADCFGLLPHSAIRKMKLALPPQLHRSIILQTYCDFIWGMYKIQS